MPTGHLTQALLCASLAGCLSVASAFGDAVKFDIRPNPVVIRARSYEASIGSDGCLTNLHIDGKEFLASDVSVSRGAYFCLSDPLEMTAVSQTENRVDASSDLAAITYEFHNDSMLWRLVNKASHGMVFFVVLSGDLDALSGPEGELIRGTIDAPWSRLAAYRSGARLEIEGCDRVWGPWQGPHHVVEVRIDPQATRELRIRISRADDEQNIAIAKLLRSDAHAPKSIRLHSPKEWQVFQRPSVGEGPVLLSGRVNAEADRLEWRLHGKSHLGLMPKGWSSTPLGQHGEFNLPLRLPAGGWYQLEVRASRGDELVASARIERFGVGEVFVGAGQSNSTNSGELRTEQTSGKVSAFDGDTWRLANDPLHGVADRSQGGSFWPAFGDALHSRYQVPIGVASTGYGGTAVEQWQPGGHLFDGTMRRVHKLGRKGFRAVLWHQGESDFQTSSEVYFERLKRTIEATRNEAGWEFPWLVAQATYHNPANPAFDAIRNAQARLWSEGVALAGPDTDQLVGDHRDFGGAGTHFSPKGLKAHGELWGQFVGDMIDEQLAQPQAVSD